MHFILTPIPCAKRRLLTWKALGLLCLSTAAYRRQGVACAGGMMSCDILVRCRARTLRSLHGQCRRLTARHWLQRNLLNLWRLLPLQRMCLRLLLRWLIAWRVGICGTGGTRSGVLERRDDWRRGILSEVGTSNTFLNVLYFSEVLPKITIIFVLL